MEKSKTKNFTPSPFQTAIFDWVKDPNPKSRKIVVSAVAGSGKSTVLVQASSLIPQNLKGTYVAFAKKNVEDLKGKLPAHVVAQTLNSVGHRTWLRFTGAKFEINGSLNYELISQYIDEKSSTPLQPIVATLTDRFRALRGAGPDVIKYRCMLEDYSLYDDVSNINRLIGLGKGAGIVPDVKGREDLSKGLSGLNPDSYSVWKSIVDDQCLDFDVPELAIEIARNVLADSLVLREEQIDYDSQLWLPIIHGARFETFDWVFADECQDQSFLQNEMITRMMTPDTRAIFVGDERQAIYGWRGALCNSMDAIRQKFSADSLPLSICYRCAKSVVAHAKEIVPHIEHFEHNEEGQVKYAVQYGPQSFGKYDAILCRNSRPIVDLAYKLYRAKVPCRILGKDIEHGFIKLAKRCAGKRALNSTKLDVISERLGVWEKREIEKLRAKNKFDPRIENVQDRAAALRVFIEELPETQRTLKGLIDAIEAVFDTKNRKPGQTLILSTVHRAKGSEWDTVFCLDSDLMPSQYARTEDAQKQEQNLIYVMRTRAKKTLVYIQSDDYLESHRGAPQYREVVKQSKEETYESVGA